MFCQVSGPGSGGRFGVPRRVAPWGRGRAIGRAASPGFRSRVALDRRQAILHLEAVASASEDPFRVRFSRGRIPGVWLPWEATPPADLENPFGVWAGTWCCLKGAGSYRFPIQPEIVVGEARGLCFERFRAPLTECAMEAQRSARAALDFASRGASPRLALREVLKLAVETAVVDGLHDVFGADV